MPYRINLGERGAFTTDDLTLDEAVEIERETGESWLLLNPFRSAVACRACIVAWLTRTQGAEEARKVAGAMSLRELGDAVERVEDDRPDGYEEGLPNQAGAPATSGLSGAPSTSGGLPT